MADIKSAKEIAEEKIAALGAPTPEERLQWKYEPQGESLGGTYLRENTFNLVAELSQRPEESRKYVARGAAKVLIKAIDLPRNENAVKLNRKAMDGIKLLKENKAAVENVYSRIRYLYNHYAEQGELQRQQAKAQVKASFEERIQKAMQQQMGPMMGAKIDVEGQPQFQQEWRKVLGQLDQQYLNLLSEYKKELTDIP